MGNLARRIERIEGQLEPDTGACLHWPRPDGTFIDIPGCRNLNDVYAKYVLPYERVREKGKAIHDDGIRQNPTE